MGKRLTELTLQGFLDWEEQQLERHEFHRGEVFAMVGARRVHNEVTGNVYSLLKGHLRGSRCRAYMETMKLRIAQDTILYPDVMVTCDADDLRAEQVFERPVLVVEVLSPTTQSYDRGAKFTLYRMVPSLREYLLIDPESREVQVFRRNADGLFTVHDLTGEATIGIHSIDCDLLIADVFDGVEPPATESPG